MIYILLSIIIIQLALIAFLWITISRIINKSIETSEILEERLKTIIQNEEKVGNILELDLYSDEPHVMDFISVMKNTQIILRKTIEDLSYYEE